MTVVNVETGELVDLLDREQAERLTTRISLKLDAMADTYVGVMPLIREAIVRQAYVALGYRSVGEYVADRFGGSLGKLGVEIRREVVRELTDAGMSTRAIAPVVGVSDRTAAYDAARVQPCTPEAPEESPDRLIVPMPPQDGKKSVVASPRPAVVGIDGKTYPPPKARPQRALPDQFFDAAFDLTKAVDRVVRLADDDRFPTNAPKVAAKHRDDLLRARDALDGVIARMP